MVLSIIAAIDQDNGIGKDNKLLCRLPKDLGRFKELTTGCILIMGRKTWESIGRPLRDRQIIVLSRNPNYRIPLYETVRVLHNWKQFRYLIDEWNSDYSNRDIFICGGKEVYRLFLPMVYRTYITWIHHSFGADITFPFEELSWRDFECFHNEEVQDGYSTTYTIYQKWSLGTTLFGKERDAFAPL